MFCSIIVHGIAWNSHQWNYENWHISIILVTCISSDLSFKNHFLMYILTLQNAFSQNWLISLLWVFFAKNCWCLNFELKGYKMAQAESWIFFFFKENIFFQKLPVILACLGKFLYSSLTQKAPDQWNWSVPWLVKAAERTGRWFNF